MPAGDVSKRPHLFYIKCVYFVLGKKTCGRWLKQVFLGTCEFWSHVAVADSALICGVATCLLDSFLLACLLVIKGEALQLSEMWGHSVRGFQEERTSTDVSATSTWQPYNPLT